MKIELSKTFRFEAAHRLPKVPPTHKCSRLHGHSYFIDVIVKGNINPEMGWLIDYADIAQAWTNIHNKLDHYYLNEIAGLENPTSEILAQWIYRELKQHLPLLYAIRVHETCTSAATYTEN